MRPFNIRLLSAIGLLMLLAHPVFGQHLVELHGPDGQVIYLNTHEITSLREPRAINRRQFVAGTRCVVVMSNGNFVAVQDRCEQVRDRVDEAYRLPHNE